MKNARDLLFAGLGAEYHEIGHIRLRKHGCLLGAEVELQQDFYFRRGLTAMPLLEQCRRLALTMQFNKRPARPPSELFPEGEPEREFSLEEKTGALMLVATNQRDSATFDHVLASQALVAGPEHVDTLTSVFQMVAMNRPESEQVPLVALALRGRGEVKDPETGEWVPFGKDLEDEEVARLPQDILDAVAQFLNWESSGWPKPGQQEGGDQPGKASSRRSSSSSRTTSASSKTRPSP